MSRLRAISILLSFLALTLTLMPVQALLLAIAPDKARRFPHWYHRQVARLLGMRLRIVGEVSRDRPALLVSNHTSWLDIVVLSAVAPVSFVAKKEVASWPFVSWLAKLQRTVFVDRERRSAVGETASEIMMRLAAGDTVVLFPEGTSSDGNRVLPFKTPLFAAVKPSEKSAGPPVAPVSPVVGGAVVQTVALVYTHLHGVPLGRDARTKVGWYGDMTMGSHAWQLLGAGPLDVRVDVGAAQDLATFTDRKALARQTERAVREGVLRILRGRGPDEALAAVEPADRRAAAPISSGGSSGGSPGGRAFRDPKLPGKIRPLSFALPSSGQNLRAVLQCKINPFRAFLNVSRTKT